MRRFFLLALSLPTFALIGCGGGGEFPVAYTTGTCTCNGEPLKMGLVSFMPIAEGDEEPGKGAYGQIQPDGTFVLSTYGSEDGAVVGKHRVRVLPPANSDRDNAPPEVQATRKNPCYNVREEIIQEITPGSNELKIELVPTLARR